MSKLDDLIRERGCDTLTALAWCQEKCAVVTFYPDGLIGLSVGSEGSSGKTIPEAVVAFVAT